MIIHYIIEAILVGTLLNLTYNHLKIIHSARVLVEMNEMFVQEYEVVYAKIVELEEELLMTQKTRDLYWGDRNSLIENFKSVKGFNDKQTDM